jgi:UTP--glucose-1-phosphate uridylyltransferase
MRPVERAAEKMRRAGVPEPAIRTFERQRERVRAGASGLLPDAELEPVALVPAVSDIPDAGAGAPLERTVVIKLNGGLATSMGLSRPKSLIEAKDGLSFLDIVVRQTLALRERHGVRLPLVLMNSFSTSAETLAALDGVRGLDAGVPLEFLQNREPKLRAEDLEPVEWPREPRLEWCPPGHGDIYTALGASGALETLLGCGYRHAFVSNADNLGAVLDPRILSWFAAERIPFLMEVVAGTEADRKGGHIARRRDGRLVLRETAQTPEEDAASFRDFRRWRHYNTNNLWIDLEALAARLDEDGGALDLPVIVNRKTVDPRDPDTPEVVQLETAMGSAIGLFDGARALCVPRTRFAPVKTTDDLLVLRSDAYALTADWRVEPSVAGREAPPFVALDPAHHRMLVDFEERFPHGPPSLAACDRLVVRGDVEFGGGVVARGSVEISAEPGAGRARVPDGAVLTGPLTL